jgi:hypothetical protein
MKRISILVSSLLLFLIFSTPGALAADVTPPQLADWTPTAVNGYLGSQASIAKTDANVIVKFILSDDSEIVTPILLLKSLSTSQMTAFATVKELSRSGKLISYEATAVIKFGQSPGIWEWVLYPLKDSLGNASSTFGPGSRWLSTVTVLDDAYTLPISMCEQKVGIWNFWVQRFIDLEMKYKGAQELEIARLKFRVPIEFYKIEMCKSADFLAGHSYDLQYNQNNELQNVITLQEDQIFYRIQRERAGEETEASEIVDSAQLIKAMADLNMKFKSLEKSYTATQLLKIRAGLDWVNVSWSTGLQDFQYWGFLKSIKSLSAEWDNFAAKNPLKTTITCVKGKLIKKVTAVKPICPKGYKKK